MPLVLSVPILGCGMMHRVPSDYQTVAADQQHDTDEAKAENAAAVRIINRRLAGKHADLAKAEKLLQDALVADVTYGPAHNSLGLVYYLQRQLYLAAWEYEYAAKLMPDRIEPVYNLALVYECAGDLDQAIATYETALAKRPQDAYIIGGLASARLRNGETVDDVRPLLEALAFHETRQEWVAWAQDHLGTHPRKIASRPGETGDALIGNGPGGIESGAPPGAPMPGDHPEVTPLPSPHMNSHENLPAPTHDPSTVPNMPPLADPLPVP